MVIWRSSLVVLLLAVVVQSYTKCPTADHSDYEPPRNAQFTMYINNEIGRPVYGYKILKPGISLETVGEPDLTIPASYGPHAVTVVDNQVYRFRVGDGMLVEISRATREGQTLYLRPCGELEPDWVDRSAEFEALVLGKPNDPPCEPAGKSGSWRCHRTLTSEEVAARPEGTFGFLREEAESLRGREYGDTFDTTYGKHLPKIPQLSNRPVLRMRQTKRMREVLSEWYKETRTHATFEPEIGGGYSNAHNITMGMLNLDTYRHIRKVVVEELQDIMEWWTGLRVFHTMTFGARVYKRDNMLINHVDRMDTHLASVVVQVAQDVDEDGGWPLEVVPGGINGEITHEVYLAPGDMVLYEGALLHHGRPMRFKGNDFCNIFSHFAPVGWNGAFTSDKNDFDFRTRDKHGHDEL